MNAEGIDAAARRLFTEARTCSRWLARTVDESELRELYRLTSLGPTSMNCQPMRLQFAVSAPARESLAAVCHAAVGGQSRGRVALRSADPFDDPSICMNYLSTHRDRDTMAEGLTMVRETYNDPAFRQHWTREVVPSGDATTGNDAASVLDLELRVRGVRGLRVVDASVMPNITSANTNAATCTIAEKAAALLRGR